MKIMKSSTALTIGGMVAVTALSGCGLAESMAVSSNGHAQPVNYSTGTEGKTNADARLPDWVPDQATGIAEIVRTTGTERILRFSSAGSKLPALCVPGAASTKAATLTADWWPKGKESRTTQICGGEWHTLVEGDVVYAYKPETVANADK